MADPSDVASVAPGGPMSSPDVPGTSSQTTNGVQPSTPPPPVPNWQTRAASLQAEYVSGGGYQFLAQYLRSMPHYIDDATRDFGADLYDRMLTDPQISYNIRLLKEETLSSGVRLEPAVQKDQMDLDPMDAGEAKADFPGRWRDGRFRGHEARKNEQATLDALEKDSQLSAEITAFCEETFMHLDRPFIEFLHEMLDGLALGNKVAEQVYEHRDSMDGSPRLALKALKVKPRESVSFVMDPYNNLIGILGLLPGQAYPVLTGSVVSDPAQIPNMLKREKFAIFTWGGQASDPRGTSLLRPVYNPWWLKQRTWGEYAKYLVKFAGPSLVGYCAANAQPVPPTDSLGNIIPGMPLIQPEQAMLNALVSFVNGSAVCFPFGAKVEPLEMSGDGSAYRQAIMLFDQQITKGITCQTLATEEGANMARAAAETHQDTLDIVALHIKTLLAAMIYHDILRPLVGYNWGNDVARRLTPRPHLAAIQQHNWARDAAAVAALMTSQYLSPSQLPEMDVRLGLPRRSAQDVQSKEMPAGPPTKGVSAPGAGGGVAAPPVTMSADSRWRRAGYQCASWYTGPPALPNGRKVA